MFVIPHKKLATNQAYMEAPQNMSRFGNNHEEYNPHLEI